MYIQNMMQLASMKQACFKQLMLFLGQSTQQLTQNILKAVLLAYLFIFAFASQAQQIPDINPIGAGYEVSSLFGFRYHPILKKPKFHDGIDFKTPIGTPVYATANGVVKKAIYGKTGYGNHIIISHSSGYETLYAHLSKLKVKDGEYVKKGQLIGYSGNSGRSVNPHLHYEVRLSGEAIDPVDYLIFAK